jgi:hypothetical protein
LLNTAFDTTSLACAVLLEKIGHGRR